MALKLHQEIDHLNGYTDRFGGKVTVVTKQFVNILSQ